MSSGPSAIVTTIQTCSRSGRLATWLLHSARRAHARREDQRQIRIRQMVGGPGFEPGASRSRTLRTLVQKRRKRSISIRIVSQGSGLHSDSGLFSCRITTRSTTPHRHQVRAHIASLNCCSQRAQAQHRYFPFKPRLGPRTAVALAKDDLRTQCAKHDVSSCLARHGDDDFAPSMSGFQIADRLRGLTESVGAVYDGCHSAGLNEFAQKDTIFLLQRS